MDKDKTIKVAKLFARLGELEKEINNELIPLCHYLQVNRQNNEVTERLEELAAEINSFLNSNFLVIEERTIVDAPKD